MGNSVAQWKSTYAPTLKRRRAQEAADNFLTPRRVMGPGPTVPAVPGVPAVREDSEGGDAA